MLFRSNAGSLPEVVGDAGLLFDPHDIEAMSASILELAGNPGLQQDLGQRAIERSSEFTWAAAAQMLFPILQAAVET